MLCNSLTDSPLSQSLMLSIAEKRMEQEAADLITAKAAYMNENCPEVSIPSGVEELQVGQAWECIGLLQPDYWKV